MSPTDYIFANLNNIAQMISYNNRFRFNTNNINLIRILNGWKRLLVINNCFQ